MKNPEITLKVLEIMNLAYLVQSETEYGVFIHFSGHVDNLAIKITESKDNWQDKVATSEFYTARATDSRLNDIIATLKAFLEDSDGNIPYDHLRAVERIEIDYKF